MSKPESIKGQPWTSFDKQPYSFIHDDFPHEKLMTVKTTAKGGRSTFNIKQSLTKSGDALKYTQQTKFWFNLKDGRSLYSRIKDNYIKIHFDNGIKDFKGSNVNLYASYQANKQLANGSIKLGARYISSNLIFDNRLRLNNFVDNKPQVTIYSKASYTKQKLSLNLFGVFNFASNLLAHNGFLATYKDDNNQYWLRLENGGWRSESFDYKQLDNIFSKIILNYSRSVNVNSKCGFQVQFGADSKKQKIVTAAYEKKMPEQNAAFKFKFSSNLSFALAVQRSLGSYGTYRCGAEVSGLGSTNNFKLGAQIDLNL